jgi:hypothetical protein
MTFLETELNRKYSMACEEVGDLAKPKSSKAKPYRKETRVRKVNVYLYQDEFEILKKKALQAGIKTSSYARAALLGADYKPPLNRELHKILLALNRELTGHGHSLRQIESCLKEGTVLPNEAIRTLDSLRAPLVQALHAVKNALAPAP